MNKINELVEASQLLCAVMDETEQEVFSFDAYSYLYQGPSFMTSPEFFLNHFKGFNIEIIDTSEERKFRLTKKIQGVTFTTRVKDLSGLKVNGLLQNNSVKLKWNKKSLRALACE